MIVRITINTLRFSVLLALILGTLFWTGNAFVLVPIHMLLGSLAFLSLWVLGALTIAKKGGVGPAVGAFVLGLVLPYVGMSQASWLVGPMHWIIQVLHLCLGLGAIGYGELLASRYWRLYAKVA